MKSIRQIRQDKKLTLEEASVYLDIDLSNLSRIERGLQYPRVETAKKMAKLYEMSLGDVFDTLSSLPSEAS